MSINRKIKRGKFTLLYNEVLKKFIFYRLSNRGKWIALNGNLTDNNSAPHIDKDYMKKLQTIK